MNVAEIIASAQADLAAPPMPTPEADTVHAAFTAGMAYGEQIGYLRGRQDAVAEQLHRLAARVATLSDAHPDEHGRSAVARWWKGQAA